MRLAEEVSSTPDATEWKFKIRSGVEFHNGQTVTADDVVATLKRHTDEQSQSGALGIVQGISDMKAEGDMVTLTLNEANADLPFLMTDYHLMIQPGGGVDNPTAGIGAGPYKVEVNEPGVRHTFKKFANYFDSSIGHVDEIEMLVINDNTARTAALQSGQVHIMNRVDPKVAELLAGVPGVTITLGAGSRALRLHHALRQGTVRQQRPADGAEAGDQPPGDGRKDPGRPGLASATTSRSTRPIRCSTPRSRSASIDAGDGGRALQEIRP